MSDSTRTPGGYVERKRVVRFAAILVGGASFLYTVVQLFDRFTQPSGPEISGRARSTTFILPKGMREALRATSQLSNLVDAYSPRPGSDDPPWGWVDRYVSVDLMNTGDADALNSRVMIGGKGLATIFWNGSLNGKNVEYVGEIPLGTIALDAKVRLNVWPAQLNYSEEMTIAFKNGRSTIPIATGNPSMYPWSYYWVMIAPVVVALMGAVGGIALFVAVRRLERGWRANCAMAGTVVAGSAKRGIKK